MVRKEDGTLYTEKGERLSVQMLVRVVMHVFVCVCSSTDTSVFVHQSGEQRGPTHKANRKYLRKQFKALLHKDKGVKKASKQCGIGLFWARLKVSKLWNVPTDLRSRICRAVTQKY